MEIVGVGTEIVECVRIARLVERHGEQFLRQVYTEEEILFCRSRKKTTETFAALWAAKEAVLKSLGVAWRQGMSWLDVAIRVTTLGEVTVELQGAVEELARERGIVRVLLSYSYCRNYATAHATSLGQRASM